ncbi:hypothetical protein BDZ97DRAFT_1922694 [Flammula alnicola]|nr:hypothetical protein BDZ97DRAFT_1922694 [Flammula alnicola]
MILHVSRWRQLSVSITNDWPSNYFFKRLQSLSAPNLEILEIYTSQYTFNPTRVTYRECFLGGTPKLTSLRMDSRCFKSCKLPCTNLTTLQLERLSPYRVTHPWTDFLDLLRSSSLVHLSLSGDFFAKPRRYISPTKVTATHLRNFRCTDKNVICFMWAFIRAPRLQLLVLKGTPLDLWAIPYNTISGDNPPLFPSLTTLAVINCQSIPICTVRLAEVTKNITRLVVSHASQDPLEKNSIVDNMIESIANPQIFWPHLKDLTFLHYSESYFGRLDASSALKLVIRHIQVSKAHFTLRILGRHDDWWRVADPASWMRLRRGNFLQLPVTPGNGSDHIPWPPRESIDFRSISELPFIT